MTQKMYLTFLVFFVSLLATSQTYQKSDIYFDNGQLRVDTSLKITPIQFELWRRAEPNIISYLVSNIDYAPIAKENEIKGLVIAAFDLDSIGINNIRLIKKVGAGLDENVLSGLIKTSKQIVYEFRHVQRVFLSYREQFNGTYYIPVDFSLINIHQEIKNKNAVPIIRPGVLIISKDDE